MNNMGLLRDYAISIDKENKNYQDLLVQLSKSRFVLMGEASHGTLEFYRDRAYLTKKLIENYGFNAVVIEGDWPDSYQLNQYVRGVGTNLTAEKALSGFKRFPTWMWRNQEMLAFIEWLKEFNQSKVNAEGKLLEVGIFGMDLYSLYTSIDIVIQNLQKIDSEMAKKAIERFSCFDHFNRDSQLYGYIAATNSKFKTCETDVINQLSEILQFRDYKDLSNTTDEYFSIIQNARLIKNAENYYRNMFSGKTSTWNLRDEHMVETISEIDQFLSNALDLSAKIIIWAHNSHVGDASHTQQGKGGEVNVGQLMRERYPYETFLLGFTTFEGTVSAASEWGGPVERKRVKPALKGSIENILHHIGLQKFYLLFKNNPKLMAELSAYHLERAIGVIYLPETERQSHYFYADIANQFDGIIHIDQTEAVRPLERFSVQEDNDVPETYPSGI